MQQKEYADLPEIRRQALNLPKSTSYCGGIALGIKVPPYTSTRVDSADLTDIQPAEYRADLVVRLSARKAVLGQKVNPILRLGHERTG
jgi:hypothetical protein